MSFFQLENVSAAIDGVEILHDISLTANEGQTLVLVGPSGCGKSTILNLLLGLLPTTAGRAMFGGQLIDISNSEQLRRQFGYVIQSGGLFPHMNVRQNVSLMAKYLGWDDTKITNRIKELFDLVRMEPDWLARFPAELSGGQRQRAALMRALMLDPSVILMDEPFGALDTLVRHELQEDLKNLFRQLGKTVVMVTHDMAEAAFFADQVALLNAGRLVQSGTVQSLISDPSDPFVTEFLTARRDLADIVGGVA